MELNLGARAFDRSFAGGLQVARRVRAAPLGEHIPLSGAVAEMRPQRAGARVALFVQGMDMDMASTRLEDDRRSPSRKWAETYPNLLFPAIPSYYTSASLHGADPMLMVRSKRSK
jgi:hypothetical protein